MAKVVENKKKVNGVLSYLVSRGKKRKWIRLKDFKEDDLPLIEMYELKQHYDIKLKQIKKQEKKDKQEIKAIKKVIYNRESNNWDFEFNTGDTLTGDQIQ